MASVLPYVPSKFGPVAQLVRAVGLRKLILEEEPALMGGPGSNSRMFTCQIRGSLRVSMVIPSQALCVIVRGRCRD
jgi:hypothetical protein